MSIKFSFFNFLFKHLPTPYLCLLCLVNLSDGDNGNLYFSNIFILLLMYIIRLVCNVLYTHTYIERKTSQVFKGLGPFPGKHSQSG